jgi:hypothetical protein
MQKKISTIVTHKNPHLDDIFAVWLLKKFGGDKFPNIKRARVEFVGGLSRDFSSEKYPTRLFVGIGNGQFDEHPNPLKKIERKEGECTSTLVAKHLGLNKFKPILQMLKEVKKNDLEGGGSILDLHQIISAMKLYQSDFDVMRWVFFALDAKYGEQLDFFTAGTDLENAKVLYARRSVGNKTLKLMILSVLSNSTQLSRFARYKYNAAVIIQKNTSGNVQIFFDKRQVRDPSGIVKAIRVREQEKKNKSFSCSEGDFSKEGSITGAEEWYYPEGGYALLNGSLTHTKPPTRIPLVEIVEAVKEGLLINRISYNPKKTFEKAVAV